MARPALNGGEVAVVGAGIAGLSAAYWLTVAGARVTVLEADRVLGGRLATCASTEFVHRGQKFCFPIEHGLHGVWREYQNLRSWLARLGLGARLVPVPSTALVAPVGGRLTSVDVGARVRSSPLPTLMAPLSLGLEADFRRALWHDGAVAYARVTRDVLPAYAFDGADLARYDEGSLAELIEKWPPYAQSMFRAMAHVGFFSEPETISQAAFYTGLMHYLLAGKQSSEFSVFDDATGPALLRPLQRTLERRGATIVLGARARSLHVRPDGRVTLGIEQEGSQRELITDGVVVATDPAGAKQLLADRGFQRVLGEERVPEAIASASVRYWLTRTEPRATATAVLGELDADASFWLDRLQQPFRLWAEQTAGSVLELHLYGRRGEWAASASDSAVIERTWRTVRRLYPNAGELIHAHVQRNPATHPIFAPSCFARLPSIDTSEGRVVRAGDWIACPHPVLYMERACTTGTMAARRLATRLGLAMTAIPEPEPPASAALSVALARRALRGVERARLTARRLLAGA